MATRGACAFSRPHTGPALNTATRVEFADHVVLAVVVVTISTSPCFPAVELLEDPLQARADGVGHLTRLECGEQVGKVRMGEGHRCFLLFVIRGCNTSRLTPVALYVVDPLVDLHHFTGRPPGGVSCQPTGRSLGPLQPPAPDTVSDQGVEAAADRAPAPQARPRPARIAGIVQLPASTVHAVLVRRGLNGLDCLDRPTRAPIRRMEMTRPGELVHVDVKKLGRIPRGGGWRIHDRTERSTTYELTVQTDLWGGASGILFVWFRTEGRPAVHPPIDRNASDRSSSPLSPAMPSSDTSRATAILPSQEGSGTGSEADFYCCGCNYHGSCLFSASRAATAGPLPPDRRGRRARI